MFQRGRRKLFVNLPVKDLRRSLALFAGLGFELDRRFTDARAACLIIREDAFVMLLTQAFFDTFAHKRRSDAATHTEAVLALTCDSRAEVDRLVEKALAAGAERAAGPLDHGFMYARGFHDLDGHHWRLSWTDPAPVLA